MINMPRGKTYQVLRDLQKDFHIAVSNKQLRDIATLEIQELTPRQILRLLEKHKVIKPVSNDNKKISLLG